MATLPRHIRDRVRTELARRFDAMRWEEIDASTASEMYERFVKDPEIGGVLAPYMAPGSIRVWIKDGPAKEYRRALEGAGYMAQYTSRAYPGVDAVVRSSLGEGWTVSPGTTDEKPMRCRAEHQDGRSMFVIWGPIGSLQALVWQAMLVRAHDAEQAITIVVTKPSTAPLNQDDWNLTLRLATIVGAECRQITYAVVRKPKEDITQAS